MPRVGDEFDWDLDMPGSRFTERPAIAIGIPEDEWYDGDAGVEPRTALARHLGEWVFEEQGQLGQGEAVEATTGRGASGIAAALEFAMPYALGGMISASAGVLWLAFLRKVRARLPEGERGFLVSRGGAAYAAAGAVAEQFGEQNELVVEAVEEPSSIAGHDVSELSYTGIEPWVVLLRRDETLRRYVVVVAPDGEIDGAIETPMREWEPGYLLPPERVRARSRRRWWQRRG